MPSLRLPQSCRTPSKPWPTTRSLSTPPNRPTSFLPLASTKRECKHELSPARKLRCSSRTASPRQPCIRLCFIRPPPSLSKSSSRGRFLVFPGPDADRACSRHKFSNCLKLGAVASASEPPCARRRQRWCSGQLRCFMMQLFCNVVKACALNCPHAERPPCPRQTVHPTANRPSGHVRAWSQDFPVASNRVSSHQACLFRCHLH